MNILKRRAFLGFALSLAMVLGVPTALTADKLDYTPEALAELKASGAPFLIDFYATWCSTCRAQEQAIDNLQTTKAAYGAIPVIKVNWDHHSNGALARDLAIPRRSTLVLMRGEEELGRLVAQTGVSKIAALLDLGL